jgi:hypothetical protein
MVRPITKANESSLMAIKRPLESVQVLVNRFPTTFSFDRISFAVWFDALRA